MTDVAIREFVAGQRELLELELKSEQEQADSNDEELVKTHVLRNLDAADLSIGLYGRTVVELVVSEASSKNGTKLLPAHRFTVGDEVEIHAKAARKDHPGGVISAVTDMSISVALFPRNQQNAKTGDDEEEDILGTPPLSLLQKSSVEVHKKLMRGLDQLERHGTSHPIAGRVVQAVFQPPAQDPPLSKVTIEDPLNQNLDKSQLEAIAFCLEQERPVALCHGPPGTGKTTTIAELIQQAVYDRGMKVLVTAPSNVAVDNVLERLVASQQQQQQHTKSRRSRKKLRAVRLGHPARVKESIRSYSLEALVQQADGTEIVADVRKELQSFLRILNNPKSRANDKRAAYREIKALRKEVRTREEKVVQELISDAQVVLATTVGAANRILDRVAEEGFDLVIIDEAAQALEASCWIPILRGKRLVLAGDHCQLPPTIKSNNSRVVQGLGKTMFERIMDLYGDTDHSKAGRVSRMLRVQYRMHENIADWASHAMYGGELQTSDGVRSRTLLQLPEVKRATGDGNIDSEMAAVPLLLIDTAGCGMYESENAAGSRYNDGEAEIVVRHVQSLLLMGVRQEDIAIITPYNGQVEILRNALLPEAPKLEIRSVDGFQGGEREAVVLSLVRSSERGGADGIGFLRDDRRQNVAVTRAKRHCAVICDSETVSKSEFIGGLLTWIENHGEVRSAIEFSSSDEIDSDVRNAEAEIERMLMSASETRTTDNSAGSQKVSRKQAAGAKANKVTQSAKANKETQAEREERRKALRGIVTDFSKTGEPGKEMALSSELTSGDRLMVHEIAEELGIGHRSKGVDGVDRRIILSIPEKQTMKPQPPETASGTLDEEENEDVSGPERAPASFAALDASSASTSDSENDEGVDPMKTSVARDSPDRSMNTILGSLAKERSKRESQKQRAAQIQPNHGEGGKKKNKSKKKKGQKLGGEKKKPPKPAVDDSLDHLDDMAFLDAQIDKVQNSHGVKIEASGKNYRTIMNGILVPKPPDPDERGKTTNKKAAAALQTKLKQAKDGRRAKTKKKR